LKTPTARAGITLVAATLAAVALGACGGGGAATETAASGAGQTLDITAVDYKFDGAPKELQKGPITVNFANEGKEAHMLILTKLNEGFTLKDAMKAKGQKGTVTDLITIPPTQPGSDAPAPAKAEIKDPGHYVLLCPLQTKEGKYHYDLGQLYEYDVE
jgi:hypothetical protein